MLFDGKFYWRGKLQQQIKKLVQIVQEVLSCNVKTNKHFRLSWKVIQQNFSAIKFPSAHNIWLPSFPGGKYFLDGEKTQHDDMTFNGSNGRVSWWWWFFSFSPSTQHQQEMLGKVINETDAFISLHALRILSFSLLLFVAQNYYHFFRLHR